MCLPSEISEDNWDSEISEDRVCSVFTSTNEVPFEISTRLRSSEISVDISFSKKKLHKFFSTDMRMMNVQMRIQCSTMQYKQYSSSTLRDLILLSLSFHTVTGQINFVTWGIRGVMC